MPIIGCATKELGLGKNFLSLILILLVSAYATYTVHPASSELGDSYQTFESFVNLEETTDSLVEATYIVVGEVKNISCKLENETIYSYVNISIISVEKGSISLKNVIVKHVGGLLDCTVLWRSDQPSFMVGEKVRVYLQKKNGIFNVVNGAAGKISLDNPLQQSTIQGDTAAGYKLTWFKPFPPSIADSTARPGPDWYGPMKWADASIPVPYWVDTRYIPAGITASSFIATAQQCYQTWQDDPCSYIAFSYQGIRTDREPNNDGTNIFCLRYIDGPANALSYCSVSATYTPGDYNSLIIIDADIVLDTGDPWSTATTCPPDKADVQNIGTHECGRSLGLAYLNDPADAPMTMYRPADYGEINKRDLAWGDQAGVRALYPSACAGGRSDLAIWRLWDGYWYIKKSSTGYTTFVIEYWSQSGDTPLLVV